MSTTSQNDYTWQAIMERHKALVGECKTIPPKPISSAKTDWDSIQRRNKGTKQYLAALPDIDEAANDKDITKDRLSKVSAEQIEFIVTHYIADTKKVKEIATELGFSRMTVYDILVRDCPNYRAISLQRKGDAGRKSRKYTKNPKVAK